MANLEVLALDTAVPQIRAPGAGDGYSVPRDMTVASGANLTLSGGTANGVLYLNGSKVATSGSAVTYDGATFATTGAANFATSSGNVGIGTASPGTKLDVFGNLRFSAANPVIELNNGGAQVYATAANTLQFASGGGIGTPVERMRIDSSGNVGIGTASPGTKLTVAASGEAGARFLGNGLSSAGLFVGYNSAAYVYNDSNTPMIFGTNSAERMRISAAGFVAIGRATTDTVRLFVQGSTTGSSDYALSLYNSAEAQLMYVRNDGLITTGATTNSPYNYTTGSSANVYVDSSGILYRSTSSLRYKSNVENAIHGLADVLKLRSVTYKAKNDGDTVFGGLIAEEVHNAGLTEFVAYDKEGRPDALHYGNMVALLVKAVQELKAELEALKAA